MVGGQCFRWAEKLTAEIQNTRFRVNKHMNNLGLTENVMCKICQTEEVTSQHILRQYKGLARLRLESIDEPYLDIPSPPPKARGAVKERQS